MNTALDYAMESMRQQTEQLHRQILLLQDEIDTLKMRIALREDQITELQFENQRLKSRIVSLPVEGTVA